MPAFLTHLNVETGVPWREPKSIQTATPDSSHQRLKLTGRATPATLLASPLLHRRRPHFW